MAEIMDCELAMLLQETPVQTFGNEKNNYEFKTYQFYHDDPCKIF